MTLFNIVFVCDFLADFESNTTVDEGVNDNGREIELVLYVCAITSTTLLTDPKLFNIVVTDVTVSIKVSL